MIAPGGGVRQSTYADAMMCAPMTSPIVRTYHHRHFDLDRLVEAKRGRQISVCLPARNEEPTVGRVVGTIRRELVERRPLVDEVLVIDDGSVDGTAAAARAAGARVVRAATVLPEYDSDAAADGGKGAAMWKALYASRGDVLVFCDADVKNFGPRFVTGVVGPLLLEDGLAFVKGFYERPLDGRPGEGGRVTELVARPLISLLFPQLAAIVQPLAGECAAPRDVLEQVPFVEGYGVDLALVVDVARRYGLGAVAQTDLGVRVHRNRPLEHLAPQAMAVLQAALSRRPAANSASGLADAEPGLDPAWSPVLLRPGREPLPVIAGERPPMVEVPAYRKSA
jgi:glucosyl-3-phosphoglycerate synthase